MKYRRVSLFMALMVACLGLSAWPTTRLARAQSGTLVNSAILSIYEVNISGQDEYVHVITAPWSETGVTWANFGNAFEPTPILSFRTDDIGWIELDVTAQVQNWVNNPSQNFGLLIEQGATYFTTFASSESTDVALRPKLDVCYTRDGGPETCVTIQRTGNTQHPVADAYIFEANPDYNGGTAPLLYTGLIEGSTALKYAMLRFELNSVTAVQLQSLTVRSSIESGPVLFTLGAAGIAGVIAFRLRRRR